MVCTKGKHGGFKMIGLLWNREMIRLGYGGTCMHGCAIVLLLSHSLSLTLPQLAT